MAYIERFEIENFKGIDKLTLKVAEKHKSPVVTLVGLNESGKTTILEALSHFTTAISTISKERTESSSPDPLTLVPIAKKANFSGKIRISALVRMEDDDKARIESLFKKHRLVVNRDAIEDRFEITRNYSFSDGAFGRRTTNWGLSFECRSPRGKKFVPYRAPSDDEMQQGEPNLWLESVSLIHKALPVIAYFPTFLVEVPDRIYLERKSGEHPSQRFYREVLQDVLSSLEEGLELEKHVVQRIRDYRDAEDNVNWLTSFWVRPEKGQIDSVIQKISSAISRQVIGSWQNIFSRSISAKLITLDWQVDQEKDATPYVTFGISDGESKYALHERSLGFRWFFLFLLFTSFKRNGDRPVLFLFDEPAANLHARAQTELLKSFDKIISGRNRIIYSTHSPHMINPQWVPAAHIIENKAINYDSDQAIDGFSSPPTMIQAIPYRQFVSANPERTSYFQPILEKLEHVQPLLSPDGPLIVTEGISDFYAFRFYCSDLLAAAKVGLLPGLGDSSHDPIISGLLARGTSFVLVLDDDKSGRTGSARYRERWLLDDQTVTTIGDLDSGAKGKALEGILSAETRDKIAAHFGNVNQATKKEIGLYFAEAQAGLINERSKDTKDIARRIVAAAIKLLSEHKNRPWI